MVRPESVLAPLARAVSVQRPRWGLMEVGSRAMPLDKWATTGHVILGVVATTATVTGHASSSSLSCVNV